jgi:MFS transporter, DHA2 family, multidrug resistance protein
VTYGLIEAGQHGWGNPSAIAVIAGGVAVVVAFLGWERVVARRGAGTLIDVALFRSDSYTWGVILQALGVMGMIGVLFTMPQFFQAVGGTDAMGSGLRLLPMVGGLILGAVPADRVARLIGAKVTVGFVLMAAGTALGAGTHAGTGEAFIAIWMAIFGVGVGLAMATASSAALVEIPKERSGVGAAVMQALNKIGGPFGAAVLGSLLSSAYRSRLDLAELPATAAQQVKGSVFVGVQLAQHNGSSALADSVRTAFSHGMDVALVASAGIAVVGALLALAFLPSRAEAPHVAEEGQRVQVG